MSYQQYPQQPQTAYAQQPQQQSPQPSFHQQQQQHPQSPPVGQQQQPYQPQHQSPQPSFQQQQQQHPQSPQPTTGVYEQQQAMAATHAVQVLPAQTQEWSNGLCDCGPCGTCMLACCCPCILVGKTSARMRDPSMQSYDTFNGECMIFCCINAWTGCGWIYGMIKREEIRQRFGIRGSGTDDCCASYWCSCCALIQQEKEVQARLGGNASVVQVVTQGYQAPSGKQGMHMPGQ